MSEQAQAGWGTFDNEVADWTASIRDNIVGPGLRAARRVFMRLGRRVRIENCGSLGMRIVIEDGDSMELAVSFKIDSDRRADDIVLYAWGRGVDVNGPPDVSVLMRGPKAPRERAGRKIDSLQREKIATSVIRALRAVASG
jgi:hypothetical protein